VGGVPDVCISVQFTHSAYQKQRTEDNDLVSDNRKEAMEIEDANLGIFRLDNTEDGNADGEPRVLDTTATTSWMIMTRPSACDKGGGATTQSDTCGKTCTKASQKTQEITWKVVEGSQTWIEQWLSLRKERAGAAERTGLRLN